MVRKRRAQELRSSQPEACNGAWHRSRPPPRCKRGPGKGAQEGAVSPAALPAPVDLHGPGGPAALRPQRRRQEASAATPPRAVYVLLTQGHRVPPPRKRCPAGCRGLGMRMRACGRRLQVHSWRPWKRAASAAATGTLAGGGRGQARPAGTLPLRVQYSPAPRRSLSAHSRSTRPTPVAPGRQYLQQYPRTGRPHSPPQPSPVK